MNPDGDTPAVPITGRRAEVLQLLQESPEALGIAELAERIGVHPNTVRFHLKALVDHGRVQAVTTADGRRSSGAGPGRPAELFRARRGMDPGGARHYRLLAEILITELARQPGARARAIAAGRRLGRQLAEDRAPDSADVDPVSILVELLDQLGFSPEQGSGPHGDDLQLRNCPFLELAQLDPQLVCAIHLGLMRGVLQARSADVRVDRLVPFAEPDRCRVDLVPAKAA